MYVIIDISGKQFRAEKDHELKIPQQQKEVEEKVSFNRVLLIDDGNTVTVGQPTVSGATIQTTIVAHGRERKVPVFKKKRRKGYRVNNTHRQDFTIIRVEDIKVKTSKKADNTSKTGE